MLPFVIQKKDKILVITHLQFIYNIWDVTMSLLQVFARHQVPVFKSYFAYHPAF